MKKHTFTDEQREYIKTNIKGQYINELLENFNEHFGLALKSNQIRAFVKNNGYKSGINTQFKKGQEPWSKGKKGILKGNSGSFKKGQKPHNHLTIGTERINGEGYKDIKVAEPNVWKQKHHIVWEKHNGKLPEEHVILFGDGNKLNTEIENLICISRNQLSRFNHKKIKRVDTEVTKTIINIGELERKISERKKSG